MTGARAGRWAVQVMLAASLAVSGYIHAKLYVDEYRFIHVVGVLFLVQASVSFAVAAVVLLGGPPLFRLVAAGVAAGALGGFVMSRTVGVFGFVERGWQPAPESLISVLVEVVALLLLVPDLIAGIRFLHGYLRRRAAAAAPRREAAQPAGTG